MTPTSFGSSRAHLLAELDRITTMLDAADEATTPELTPGPDTAEVTGTAPSALPLALPADDRRRITGRTDRIAARRAATEGRLRLARITSGFGLSRRHLDCLLLALAPRLDSSLAGRYEQLQEHTLLSRLTVSLLEQLFARTPGQRVTAGRLLGADSPLSRHGLLTSDPPPEGYPTRRGRQFVVADRVLAALRGTDTVDPALCDRLGTACDTDAAPLRLVSTARPLSALSVEPQRRERLESMATEAGGGRRWYFYGPDEAGQRRITEAVCATDHLLRADLPSVRSAGALDAVAREATLLDCPLHLSGAAQGALADVFDRLVWADVDIAVTGSEAWAPPPSMDATVDASLELPSPSQRLRRQFWENHSEALPAALSPETLANTFRLTRAGLDGAWKRAQARADGETPTAADVYAGCRTQSADGLGDIARRVETDAEWADIELPSETERALATVRDHVTQQGRLADDWGYDGRGVVALFEGPSGTGKTMAAEVLADAVGMGLYRVDLSTVVSKYVGETESKLESLFVAAENANAVLLFDEADAVFGDRAEVSEATDRYANAEVNYLLQRIEAYDGVVVLTTNYESNIDAAFARRIDHTVTFARPDAPIRRRIWASALPEAAPTAELDEEFLASFPLTGGQITTVARTAAISAAAAGRQIEMVHLVRALHRELDAVGKLVDPTAFEPYRDCLDGHD